MKRLCQNSYRPTFSNIFIFVFFLVSPKIAHLFYRAAGYGNTSAACILQQTIIFVKAEIKSCDVFGHTAQHYSTEFRIYFYYTGIGFPYHTRNIRIVKHFLGRKFIKSHLTYKQIVICIIVSLYYIYLFSICFVILRFGLHRSKL